MHTDPPEVYFCTREILLVVDTRLPPIEIGYVDDEPGTSEMQMCAQSPEPDHEEGLRFGISGAVVVVNVGCETAQLACKVYGCLALIVGRKLFVTVVDDEDVEVEEEAN